VLKTDPRRGGESFTIGHTPGHSSGLGMSYGTTPNGIAGSIGGLFKQPGMPGYKPQFNINIKDPFSP